MKINMPYKIVPLSEVVYFQEGPGLRNWQYANEGIPFLNIRTLTDEGFINKSLCQCVKKEEFTNKYEHFLLDEGDFVVSSSGTLGKLAEVRKQDLPIMLNTSVIRFRPLDTNILDRDFLKWFIKSPLYFRQIESASTGTAIKNYGPSHLKKMVIPLPPIASQRRIANILDKADEIIRKRKEAIALTEQLQKSIFLDMFGDPVTNPKGWEVEELNNVISIISGQVDPKVEPFIDMPHIGGENLQSNTNNIQNIKTPRELKLKSGKYLFQSGNVLYSKIRPYLNQVVITDFSGVCSADIYPLRVIETKIKNDFLIYLLRSKFFLDYAQKHSTRTNIPKINRPTLLSFRFPCPPINIQKDFSDKCNKITQIQKNFNQYLTESENLFNSLLQKAFKGEL